MKKLSEYKHRNFLKEHPPIMQRVLIHSTGEEEDLISGSVLGVKEEKQGLFVSGATPTYILAEDITVPASGDIYALAYCHAALIESELVWGDGVSATDQKEALEALRIKGLYASEA